jgi:regulator of protease activity HflC (stomatin/prohibitin superfamily)
MTPFKLGALAAVALVALSTVFGAFYTVDEGERAVITYNGAVSSTADPGLHFKLPFVQGVHTVSVRSNVKQFEAVPAYSKDQQTAVLALSVNYKVPADQVQEVYANYGSAENVVSRILERRVLEQTKNVFGRYTAVMAIQERGKLNAEIAQAITAGVAGPIIVESVQIENIDFSDAYEAAVDARMLAEVEVQKLRQNAEREKVQAEITVTQAQATADATLAQAKAEADAVRLRGEAQASAIEARGRALRDNPGVVQLVQAEKWNGALPTTMVPDATTPFMALR